MLLCGQALYQKETILESFLRNSIFCIRVYEVGKILLLILSHRCVPKISCTLFLYKHFTYVFQY